MTDRVRIAISILALAAIWWATWTIAGTGR